ncbi:MAG: GntR family transcriptional regulator [Candidatus Omnitrophica bacterium]|nr:GntR family transcriptional regulator [Candidatus Omnitrophota bacterium]
MLPFQVDSHSGVPVYRQIMDQIKYYVSSGVMFPECKLPSIRELAQFLTVNPSTIIKAYKELEHEGVIESLKGKGFFVSESAPKMTDDERREALRRMARRMLSEAHQMGASEIDVLQALDEERLAINPNSDLIVSLVLRGIRRDR